jgi:hypothetical protein
MAKIDRPCDIYQGYNYKKDVQSTVGFITALKIGDKELKANQTCKDPENPTTDLEVVAVLSSANWSTGNTDAVYFSGQISISNRQEVALLVLNDLTKIEVSAKFVVYDYDLLSKQYFKAFHSNDAEMKGLLEKSGDDLSVSVADEASSAVQSPANYDFFIGIKPQPEQQDMHVATSVDNKIVKAWGVKVA